MLRLRAGTRLRRRKHTTIIGMDIFPHDMVKPVPTGRRRNGGAALSANAYEILALAMRYVFVGLMLLIVARAWRVTATDSKRARKLRRLSPDTGIIGEMLVVDGGERAKPGMRYPVTLEGAIGSGRRADIRVRHSTVRSRHAFYQMTDDGLYVRGHANARIRDGAGQALRDVLLDDGDVLQVGRVKLMLVLIEGGNAPDEIHRHVLRRRHTAEPANHPSAEDDLFAPEADDLFLSNPASAFDEGDGFDAYDDLDGCDETARRQGGNAPLRRGEGYDRADRARRNADGYSETDRARRGDDGYDGWDGYDETDRRRQSGSASLHHDEGYNGVDRAHRNADGYGETERARRGNNVRFDGYGDDPDSDLFADPDEEETLADDLFADHDDDRF